MTYEFLIILGTVLAVATCYIIPIYVRRLIERRRNKKIEVAY